MSDDLLFGHMIVAGLDRFQDAAKARCFKSLGLYGDMENTDIHSRKD